MKDEEKNALKVLLIAGISVTIVVLCIITLAVTAIMPILIEEAIDTGLDKLSTLEIHCSLEPAEEALTVEFEGATHYCQVTG